MQTVSEEPAVRYATRLEPEPAPTPTVEAILPAHEPRAVRPARSELADRARSGDRLAFERLVEPWIEPAYRTGLAILGRDADARDATQDALLEAWRNIRRLRDPERFDAWLGRIHVNACRAIGRRRGRSSVREIAIDMLPDPEATCATAGASAWIPRGTEQACGSMAWRPIPGAAC
jgi:hypothetical protein